MVPPSVSQVAWAPPGGPGGPRCRLRGLRRSRRGLAEVVLEVDPMFVAALGRELPERARLAELHVAGRRDAVEGARAAPVVECGPPGEPFHRRVSPDVQHVHGPEHCLHVLPTRRPSAAS